MASIRSLHAFFSIGRLPPTFCPPASFIPLAWAIAGNRFIRLRNFLKRRICVPHAKLLWIFVGQEILRNTIQLFQTERPGPAAFHLL